jgi:hypothetical protein
MIDKGFRINVSHFMKDLSLHLLDILENSAKAGATAVMVHVTWRGPWLHLEIADNGPGFPDGVKADPTDPFLTTRTDRSIGLGLALLRAAAEQTGGRLELGAAPGGGVLLRASFDFSHCDAKPLGPLEDALSAAMLAWPKLDLFVRVGPDRREVLNTQKVKEQLGTVDIGNTQVQVFLHQLFRQELAPLYDWAATLSLNTGNPNKERHQA